MRFELLSQLGAGAFGIAYRARDLETGEIVALKQLKPEVAAQPGVVDRFKQELLLTRKVTHKNVCRVYDLYRENDGVFISMEYVDGERLRDRLDRVGRLDVDEGMSLAGALLDGIEAAHGREIIHRDLKPENVMIATDGTVKVMDFGLARSIDPDATTGSIAGTLSGTPAYMSPEQALGQPVDARSDIYALGLMFYEMFSGQRAFTGDSPISVAMKQVNETPIPLLARAPTLPAHITQAIERCLSKDRTQRFGSIAELRMALVAPAHEPAGGAPAPRGVEFPGTPSTASSSVWQRPLVIVSVAATAILLAGVAVWASLRQVPVAPTSSSHGGVVNVPPGPVTERPEQTAVTGPMGPAPSAAMSMPATNAAADVTQAEPQTPASVAVLDFSNLQRDPQFSGFQTGIADAFTASFAASKRFRVVERTQLEKVMSELRLNRSEAVDARTAQQVGRLIGARYLVLGSFQVFQGDIMINARLLRTETGEVIGADKITGRTTAALTLPDKLAASFLSQIP